MGISDVDKISLSQENIDKIHPRGIYRCDPVLEWLPSYKRDNPYWCRNWTFKVHQYHNDYYMADTYWSSGDDHAIKLTNENFDKFEYLFDLDNIKYVNEYSRWLEYPPEDRWCVGLDSGGMGMPKYVVRKDAKKIKEKVIERLCREINILKDELATKQRQLDKVIGDEIDYEYV